MVVQTGACCAGERARRDDFTSRVSSTNLLGLDPTRPSFCHTLTSCDNVSVQKNSLLLVRWRPRRKTGESRRRPPLLRLVHAGLILPPLPPPHPPTPLHARNNIQAEPAKKEQRASCQTGCEGCARHRREVTQEVEPANAPDLRVITVSQ